MLKWKIDKLESRTDACLFVGYPRGTKGGLFYCPKDQKVIISTNAQFLEENYVMNHKPISKIVLEELKGDIPIIPIVQKEPPQDKVIDIPLPRHNGRNVVTRAESDPSHVATINTPVVQPGPNDGGQGSGSTQQNVPRRSGRVVHQPDQYMFLGESYDRIPDELDTEPSNYYEALQDKDAELLQKAMKSEMESMYSNQVWDLVEPPEGIKPIGCK
ncbi:uncharacterized protein LOC131155923 [Malania oleifera]|uniref:uncharacterized protein LOC131155923 n=1 Tax=Malania oleifera TaxID=397392 RepID=UPI0025ADCFD1|nr:uncharacterized protein LOC131155923 [Malania oleifera]